MSECCLKRGLHYGDVPKRSREVSSADGKESNITVKCRARTKKLTFHQFHGEINDASYV